MTSVPQDFHQPHPYGGQGLTILAVTWTVATIALVITLMRTYTNAVIVKSFKWDFLWALVTLLNDITAMVLTSLSVAGGMGNHIYRLEPFQVVKSLRYFWITQIMIIQSNGFGKFAVIAFLLRIQNRVQGRKIRYLSYVLYFVAITNFCVDQFQTAFILTACSPSAKLWDPVLNGTCDGLTRLNNSAYFSGTWAATSDFTLAIYPVAVFWNLKVSKGVKIGLCLLMAGGCIAGIAGIVRTVAIKLISVQVDQTYDLSFLFIWSWTEQWLILILGSLPPLQPLFLIMSERVSDCCSRYKSRLGSSSPRSFPGSIPLHSAEKKDHPGEIDSKRRYISPETGILRTTRVDVVRKVGDFRASNYDSFEKLEQEISV